VRYWGGERSIAFAGLFRTPRFCVVRSALVIPGALEVGIFHSNAPLLKSAGEHPWRCEPLVLLLFVRAEVQTIYRP
jgi:hypothetical protein